MKSVFEDYKMGICQYENIKKKRSTAEKTQIARAWMSNYFGKIGEKMPHLEQVHRMDL